jgi:hypothetical protein
LPSLISNLTRGLIRVVAIFIKWIRYLTCYLQLLYPELILSEVIVNVSYILKAEYHNTSAYTPD